MQGAARIEFEKTVLGVRYNLVKDPPNGNRFVRHAECIVPNAFVIPDMRETGTVPKRKQRGSELSWAVPVDNVHVTGLSIVAWPLEDGAPKKDWRPGTDTIQDKRPGSVLTRKYEDRQRKPDDLEAQEGQRPIAVHALENLGTSNTGITMLRHLLREQVKRVEGRPGSDECDARRPGQSEDPDQRVQQHSVARRGIRISSERGVRPYGQLAAATSCEVPRGLGPRSGTVLIQPSGIGGTNWAPMSYNPDTGSFYVVGTVRTSAYGRYGDTYKKGLRYVGGTQSAPIGSPMSGTFTAVGGNTNKIVWQNKTPYRIGNGGGSTTTAGGLVFHGEPDGNFLAYDAKTGEELWKFQTGFGAKAPPVVYEVDGDQYIAIAAGGNQATGSAYGDAVWSFSLKGQVNPLWPPPPPSNVAGPTGPISDGVDKVDIGARNVEYSYFPARTRIKKGTTVTFTNVGDIPHTATAVKTAEWDTGSLAKGEANAITFKEPGIYYYICTPHPWMYWQIIVE
jgi:plastocyanin